jgi:hypothetical protein
VFKHELCTLIINGIKSLNQSSKKFIKFLSNSKSGTVFNLLFKIHRDLVKVEIIKVVPNDIIYLLEFSQNFPKPIAIFPGLKTNSVFKEKDKELRNHFLFSGPLSPPAAAPTLPVSTVPRLTPAHCDALAGNPRPPHHDSRPCAGR